MQIKTNLLKPYKFNKEFFDEIKGTDYEGLKEDIRINGIKVDLHITKSNIIICGHQRWNIAKELNLDEVPCKIINIDESDDNKIKEYAIKDNLLRRQLTTEQKWNLIAMLSEIYEVGRGIKTKEQPRKEGKFASKDVTMTSIEDDVLQKTAKNTGVSERTVARARAYKEIIDISPELKQKPVMQVINNYEIKNHKIVRKNTKIDLDIDLASAYDENLYYLTHKKTNSEEFDKLLIEAKEKDMKVYNGIRLELFKMNCIPALTTMGEMFHSSGKEFSIREYADVQDFPKDYKFVGNKSDIKFQIGDAVSPKMSEYIIRKYIKGKSYIELFCGCGGFSCGAKKLKKECLWAIDFSKLASYSFKLNNPESEIYVGDILNCDEKEIHKKIKDVDFILGGVPCQGFSSVGKQLGFKEDSRNQLYLEFLRFVKEFKPKQFIIENVKEILDYQDEIIKDFEKIGYDVQTELVIGTNIGMNQDRKRAFFIGNLKGG